MQEAIRSVAALACAGENLRDVGEETPVNTAMAKGGELPVNARETPAVDLLSIEADDVASSISAGVAVKIDRMVRWIGQRRDDLIFGRTTFRGSEGVRAEWNVDQANAELRRFSSLFAGGPIHLDDGTNAVMSQCVELSSRRLCTAEDTRLHFSEVRRQSLHIVGAERSTGEEQENGEKATHRERIALSR